MVLSVGCRTTIGLLAAVFLASCGQSQILLPEVPDRGAETIAGVVYTADTVDGISQGDVAGSSLMVELGVVDGVVNSADSKTVTNDSGQFVLDVPEPLIGKGNLFVQATFNVPGPDGHPIAMHIRDAVESGTVDNELILPVVSKCEEGLAEMVEDASLCGSPLLPDLVPLVEGIGSSSTQPVGAESVLVDRSTIPGRVLLRVGSATANLGAGALHMIPEQQPLGGGTIHTWQRIWTSRLRYVDHKTGAFVFHPDHQHFHLQGFEQYRLLESGGNVVAIGEKVSFCLIDAINVDDGRARLGTGIFLDVACEDAGEQQVLNPGWADYYGPSLPDQWIDITGVSAGKYMVEIIVDPDNVLLESNERNNRTVFPVSISKEMISN